jgi:AcrR family transcriptional regulator
MRYLHQVNGHGKGKTVRRLDTAVSGKPRNDPSPPRRKRRSPAEIRKLVLEAAAEMFEAHGYGSATTAAIARRADVTEAQIFRYFASKAALFRAAIFEPLNAHFADFQARQGTYAGEAGSYRDQARTYITELQAFIATHSRMLQSLVVAEAYDRRATGGVEGLEGLGDYFARGAAMMVQRMGDQADQARVPPEVMVRVSFAAVLGCALFGDWMFAESAARPEQIHDGVIDFVIDGLNSNGDAEGAPPPA